ncbi:MAG TPA: response regulator [Myxococcales bacterium]|nr:response regulator [Myxococcales bacterium]
MPRPSVLVVDDDADHRTQICTALDQAGFDAVPASDGKHALELLDVGLPSMVLLDLLMPEKDGWQVVFELRANRRSAGVPIVVVSAMPPDALHGAPVDGYLEKPFTVEELLREVRKRVY